MKQWIGIFSIPLFLICMPVLAWADGGRQGEGVGFSSILTGGVTLLAVLFAFSLGFLGRRGIIKFNIKLHSLGAYTAVSLAIIHVIVNVLAH